jgi:hypothetical protein
MKRFTLILAAAFGLVLTSGNANAFFGDCCYNTRKNCEELRSKKSRHDYDDALRRYYKSLDPWVAYYKNHGYPINGSCGGSAGGPAGPGCGPMGPGCGPTAGCCPRINYTPVFVSPCMQWAVPGGYLNGPGGLGCAP